ncbi:MAG: hypothetical protein ABI587_12000 [Gemmatimonadales bacterium]
MRRHSWQLLLLLVSAFATVHAQDRPAPEVRFSVLVLMNGFYTSAKTNNSDLPQFAVPRNAGDSFPTDGAGATMRQTRLRANAFASGVAGGDFTAELDVDFWGGQQPSNGGRTFPLLRIRRAWAQLDWDRVRVFAGQEAPLIVELNPSSLGSVGLSALSSSGNLWLWIPQLRLSGDLVGRARTRLSLEAAILAPTGYVAQGPFLTQPDRAEQSNRPYLQSRLRLRWGEGGSQGQVSVGGHLGWLSTAGDSLLPSRGAAALLQLPVGHVFEFRGEAFTGQALAGLGGGGIGQNLGPGDVPVRTHGGWGQLLLKPAGAWELGVSYGIDDPKDADLDPLTQRLRNETFGGHLHWRPAPLVIGLEYRRISTTYGAGVGKISADHVNLALGAEF